MKVNLSLMSILVLLLMWCSSNESVMVKWKGQRFSTRETTEMEKANQTTLPPVKPTKSYVCAKVWPLLDQKLYQIKPQTRVNVTCQLFLPLFIKKICLDDPQDIVKPTKRPATQTPKFQTKLNFVFLINGFSFSNLLIDCQLNHFCSAHINLDKDLVTNQGFFGDQHNVSCSVYKYNIENSLDIYGESMMSSLVFIDKNDQDKDMNKKSRCKNDWNCNKSGSNLECINGKCECNPNTHVIPFDASGHSSCLPFVKFNEACLVNEQCSKIDHNMFCSRRYLNNNKSTKNNIKNCTCKSGYAYDLISHKCVKHVIHPTHHPIQVHNSEWKVNYALTQVFVVIFGSALVMYLIMMILIVRNKRKMAKMMDERLKIRMGTRNEKVRPAFSNLAQHVVIQNSSDGKMDKKIRLTELKVNLL